MKRKKTTNLFHIHSPSFTSSSPLPTCTPQRFSQDGQLQSGRVAADDSEEEDVQEVQSMGRDKVKKKTSSSSFPLESLAAPPIVYC
ncbi:hypothetical protein Tco_0661074 [Tanacetum coccineum]